MKKSKIETGVFSILMGDDNICRTIVKEKAEINLNDAKAATEAVIRLSDGEIGPILVDLKKIKSISKDAREHFTMKGRKAYVNAIGLVVKSPVSMLIGNFFQGINKSSVPTKLFTSEKKAILWLAKFV